jgi:hypothetical protein
MLEYPFDEANALLNKNMTTATDSLATVEKDLSFIKDQITTTEVSNTFGNASHVAVHVTLSCRASSAASRPRR